MQTELRREIYQIPDVLNVRTAILTFCVYSLNSIVMNVTRVLLLTEQSVEMRGRDIKVGVHGREIVQK